MSLAGQQVGTYLVGPCLGAGGMAEVYEGHHVNTQLGRKVAIKVLRAEHCNNPDLVNRFVNEAKALGRLSHPGVVHIYDVAYLSDGRVCLIMEFLSGKTLFAFLRERGQLSAQEAVPVMIQLADTLAAAHDQQIIHRDIKPENIFVVPDQFLGVRTKVLDFGVAKLVNNAGAVQTRTRTTLGTAAYMPPEQFRSSKDVDHRSDIYSLGCVFFELMGGRPPFVAETLVDHMRMHAFEQPPSLSSVAPSTPAPLDQMITRMLAKNPAERFSSMREIKHDLEVIQSGGQPGVRGPGSGVPQGHYGHGHSGPVPAPHAGPGSAPHAGPIPGGHPGGHYSGPNHAGHGYGHPGQYAGGGAPTAHLPPPGYPGARYGPGTPAERRGLIAALVVITLVVAICAALVVGFT